MVKVLFQGQEIELDNEIESGERELDMLQKEEFGETIDINEIIQKIEVKDDVDGVKE